MTEPYAEFDTLSDLPTDGGGMGATTVDPEAADTVADAVQPAEDQTQEPSAAATLPDDGPTAAYAEFVAGADPVHLTVETATAPTGLTTAPVEVIDRLHATEIDDGYEEYDEESLRQGLFAELQALGERLMVLGPAHAHRLTALTGKLVERLRGNYTVDEFGLDPEFRQAVMPFFNFMYDSWWRVEMYGAENVPTSGRGLLVANHSGVLPWDGAMIFTGLQKTMKPPRLTRALVANWFPTLPFLSIFLTKTGQVMASHQNGERLLESDELVVVFPEGYKGVGKLYRDRYNLARFGRGGFIRMALKTGAPIIPVAVTGAEETYPMVYNAKWLAKMIGFPYFPVTPTFPWLGLLGVIPLPSKWHIDIGEPIVLPEVDERAMANPVTVARLTEQVRTTIQGMLYARLRQRTTIFLG